MKTQWKANSTEPTDLTGVGTLVFDTGTVNMTFDAFIDFHRLTTLLDRELHNVAWAARDRLKREIEGIET